MIMYCTKKGKQSFLLYFFIFHKALSHRSEQGIHNVNNFNSLSFAEFINLEMYIAKPMLCQKKSVCLYLVSVNSFYPRYNIINLLSNGTLQAVVFSPGFKHLEETKYIMINLLQWLQHGQRKFSRNTQFCDRAQLMQLNIVTHTKSFLDFRIISCFLYVFMCVMA